MKVFSILIPGLILIAVLPLAAANWWVETTQEDFVDGSYNATLYAADTGIAGDGAVQMIHFRDIDKDGNLDLLISNNRIRWIQDRHTMLITTTTAHLQIPSSATTAQAT